MTTTTPKTYPTLTDKVALFEQNGIDVFDYLDAGNDDYGLRIGFNGNDEVARHAERVARDNGIKLLRMSLVYEYSGGSKNKPHPPYWLMTFPH